MKQVRVITVAGPPSCGKTSILLKVLESEAAKQFRFGVVKFDCLNDLDGDLYRKNNVPFLSGIAGNICPDHFFITNIEDCFDWAQQQELDLLFVESAGLCNRCSPHLRDTMAVCVLDCLSGIRTPYKIGPMLKLADSVVLTKADLISQAEREVFRYRVAQVNSKAKISYANGINGQGCTNLLSSWLTKEPLLTMEGTRLRFSMPTAVCSYCLGETMVGKDRQVGIVRRIAQND